MYKGLLTHSLLCSKFVELTLGYITVAPCLLKVFVVQLSTLFEKEYYPACVKRCPKQEDKEDAEIIDCKNDTEDQKCEEREEQT